VAGRWPRLGAAARRRLPHRRRALRPRQAFAPSACSFGCRRRRLHPPPPPPPLTSGRPCRKSARVRAHCAPHALFPCSRRQPEQHKLVQGSHTPLVAVLGSQWGDEGKGKLVDILAQRYDIVARCQARRQPESKLACLSRSAGPRSPRVQ